MRLCLLLLLFVFSHYLVAGECESPLKIPLQENVEIELCKIKAAGEELFIGTDPRDFYAEDGSTVKKRWCPSWCREQMVFY